MSAAVASTSIALSGGVTAMVGGSTAEAVSALGTDSPAHAASASVVTTVADQDVDRQHPGYFIARVRVRSDTLEWDVLRAESGDWVVCNGLHFGLDAPDSLTAWRPNGASAATARALADSIGARR